MSTSGCKPRVPPIAAKLHTWPISSDNDETISDGVNSTYEDLYYLLFVRLTETD